MNLVQLSSFFIQPKLTPAAEHDLECAGLPINFGPDVATEARLRLLTLATHGATVKGSDEIDPPRFMWRFGVILACCQAKTAATFAELVREVEEIDAKFRTATWAAAGVARQAGATETYAHIAMRLGITPAAIRRAGTLAAADEEGKTQQGLAQPVNLSVKLEVPPDAIKVEVANHLDVQVDAQLPPPRAKTGTITGPDGKKSTIVVGPAPT